MLKRIFTALSSFVRPHLPAMRRRSAAPREVPHPAAPQPEGSSAHLLRTDLLGKALDEALRLALRPGEQGPPARAPRLRGRWKKDILHLAMICSDMLPLAPALFPGLPATPEGLRRLVKEVTMLENMVGCTRQFLKKLERLLAARKDELCSATQAIVDTVEGLSNAPLLPAEQRDLVKFVAAPIRAHLRERNGKVQQKRRHRQHIREQIAAQVAEVREELERVQVENHILRGGSAQGMLKG